MRHALFGRSEINEGGQSLFNFIVYTNLFVCYSNRLFPQFRELWRLGRGPWYHLISQQWDFQRGKLLSVWPKNPFQFDSFQSKSPSRGPPSFQRPPTWWIVINYKLAGPRNGNISTEVELELKVRTLEKAFKVSCPEIIPKNHCHLGRMKICPTSGNWLGSFSFTGAAFRWNMSRTPGDFGARFSYRKQA